jgi:hypothetical protein
MTVKRAVRTAYFCAHAQYTLALTHSTLPSSLKDLNYIRRWPNRPARKSGRRASLPQRHVSRARVALALCPPCLASADRSAVEIGVGGRESANRALEHAWSLRTSGRALGAM